MNGRTCRALNRMVSQISNSVPEKDLNHRKTKKNLKKIIKAIKKSSNVNWKKQLNFDIQSLSRDINFKPECLRT